MIKPKKAGVIPAGPFIAIVRQFAKANGLRFLTMDQQRHAIVRYCNTASRCN